MSIETAVVINYQGEVIYWHLPEGRSAGYLPDSRNLWDVIWENRDNLLGIAHSHPGGGTPGPSHEDVTTFAAVEAALGKRLTWWIMSHDQIVVIQWAGPDKYDYRELAKEVGPDGIPYEWVDKLHKLSYCAKPIEEEEEQGESHGQQV